MYKASRFWFLAAFFITFLTAPAANAQKILTDYKKPLPKLTLVPEEQFIANTTAYEEVPVGDKALSYRVRLPKNWIEGNDGGLSNFALSDKIFGEVARFYSPPSITTERSRFTIQAIKLEYQLTAEQWIMQYLLTNGYAIQGLESHNDEKVEALFVLIENQISYVVRAVAQINGKRVVLAQYFMPMESWETEKAQQAQVIGTFHLANPDRDYVEEMDKYQFLDIAEMLYPASWELRSPPLRSIDYMDAQLLNVAGKGRAKQVDLNGKIDVRLVSVFVTDVETATTEYKGEMKKAGLVLRSILETPTDFTFHSMAGTTGTVEVYEATDSKNSNLNYEWWLVQMTAGDYHYYIALLTPSRDDDYFTWSRNTQTLRMVVSLMSPQETSVVEQ